MRDTLISRLATHAAALSYWLRQPQLMVFLPAATLTAYWLGGDRALLFAALGLPLLFALAGALLFEPPREAAGARFSTATGGRRRRR